METNYNGHQVKQRLEGKLEGLCVCERCAAVESQLEEPCAERLCRQFDAATAAHTATVEQLNHLRGQIERVLGLHENMAQRCKGESGMEPEDYGQSLAFTLSNYYDRLTKATEALSYAQRQMRVIQGIRWGHDGDCGADALARRVEDVVTDALSESKPNPHASVPREEFDLWKQLARDLHPLALAWAGYWGGAPQYGNGMVSSEHQAILARYTALEDK